MKEQANWRTNWEKISGFDRNHMSFREELEVANI
jgi:hypothetical protein